MAERAASGVAPGVLIFHKDADAYAAALRARVPGIDLVATADEAAFRRALPAAEVLVAFQFPVDALPAAGRLRWIQIVSAGVDFLAPVAAQIPHVTITNGRGIHGGPIADYVLAGITMLQSDFPGWQRAQAARQWQRHPVVPLEGRTLGIVGLGAIGQEIARRAAGAGMRVLGVRRSGAPAAHVEQVFRPEELDRFLPRCDAVVLVVPDTAGTRAMIGPAQFAAMRRSAFIVNVGRGSAIDERALAEALAAKTIAGACLDVFEVEPLPADSPLWTLPNVIITPHVAGMRVDYIERFTDIMADNLGRHARGEPLRNIVEFSRGY